jgi:hypothetical protein
MFNFGNEKKDQNIDWETRVKELQAKYQKELDALTEEFPIGSIWNWLGIDIVVSEIGIDRSERYCHGFIIPPYYKEPAVSFIWRQHGEEKKEVFYPNKLEILRCYQKQLAKRVLEPE